ncbi:MAG: translesion DNA synthesis-associated protein ImuA [Deltaproteobacteria bacterium]|nr:translesion DNA synthesis-associated protein ImuA [Deltaproteobacteria bacterium]
MSQALASLRAHPAFWGSRTRETLSTGYPRLDSLLPHGGWPLGGLIEILFPGEGAGELQLLIPALAKLSGEGRWLAWISPPHLPFGPALRASGVDLSRLLVVQTKAPREDEWALEQTLGSGACGAALAWPESGVERSLRRLQLAAERGGSLGFLFRPSEAARQPSPAALRLGLSSRPGGFLVRVLKGGWGEGTVILRPGLAPERHDG